MKNQHEELGDVLGKLVTTYAGKGMSPEDITKELYAVSFTISMTVFRTTSRMESNSRNLFETVLKDTKKLFNKYRKSTGSR